MQTYDELCAEFSSDTVELNGDLENGNTVHGNNTGGIPPGGKAGQYLRKRTDADGDVEWANLEIPEQYGLVTYDQDKTITIT